MRYKNQSRILSVLLTAALLALFLPFGVQALSLPLSAECAVLMECATRTVLYEKNADLRHGMASTTKIMTALCALENAGLNDEITVDSRAVGVQGSSIYLYGGEQLTLEELLYAVLLQSANDAAEAVAIAVSGSVEEFAALMNQKAEALQLHDTHFTNPHGLSDDNHYTTARELALITAAAMENETFRTMVSTYKKEIPQHNGEGTRLLVNHNKLLRRYEGCIGVKTGYTMATGRCLVSAAERNGMTLIAVTLNASDDWNDHTQLLDYGFAHYRLLRLADPSQGYTLPAACGTQDHFLAAPLYAQNLLQSAEDPEPECAVELKRFYYAPIRAGEIVGRLVYRRGKDVVAEIPIAATEDVAESHDHSRWTERLLSWLAGLFANQG